MYKVGLLKYLQINIVFTYEKLIPQEKFSTDKHLVFLISPFNWKQDKDKK